MWLPLTQLSSSMELCGMFGSLTGKLFDWRPERGAVNRLGRGGTRQDRFCRGTRDLQFYPKSRESLMVFGRLGGKESSFAGSYFTCPTHHFLAFWGP